MICERGRFVFPDGLNLFLGQDAGALTIGNALVFKRIAGCELIPLCPVEEHLCSHASVRGVGHVIGRNILKLRLFDAIKEKLVIGGCRGAILPL